MMETVKEVRAGHQEILEEIWGESREGFHESEPLTKGYAKQ